MTLSNYLDFEPPLADEGWTVVEVGNSTAERITAAGFSERGSYGLRATGGTDASYKAYAKQTGLNVSVAAGGSVFIGRWMRLGSLPSNYTYLSRVVRDGPLGSTSSIVFLRLESNGTLKLFYTPDTVGYITSSATSGSLAAGRWYWVVVEIHRASGAAAGDGYIRIYVDGVIGLTTPNYDNYDRANSLKEFQVGITNTVRNGFVVDHDEIKIADSYPEPYIPAASSDYPCAERTVVLYRQDSADSREFADYCVSQLGVPRGMLCPLPNATGDEILSSYPWFQLRVENDLNAWLALNPTAAAQVTCFLIGYGVHGGFYYIDTTYSATARLMNLGNAFSQWIANPLYQSTARVTRDTLGSGQYLATRIDADTLQHAKDIIDNAATVAALSGLTDADKLYSDDSDYKASLACQKLRIVTAAMGEFANDAFVFGDTASPTFGTAGSRAAFVDDSDNSGTYLRHASFSACGKAINTAGYAAAMGFSHYASSENFDAETFFEHLRAGHTFAEASLCASQYIDGRSVPVGSPFMTVNFQAGGYNVYHGEGGCEAIDWDQPVGCTRRGSQSVTVAADLVANHRHAFAVRVVSSAGVEERNTHVVCFAETDQADQLTAAPLPCPLELSGRLLNDDTVRFGFSCRTLPGHAQPGGFEILSDYGSGTLDTENPAATISQLISGRSEFVVDVSFSSLPIRLAVRAVLGQQQGPQSATLTISALRQPVAPVIV